MNAIKTTAPGKAFLCGEFASLDGAPAIVMAVDRRVAIEASPRDARDWVVTVVPPGGQVVQSLEALQSASPLRNLLAAVVQALHGAERALPANLRLESRIGGLCDDRGRPRGLGSSAASSVALTAALAPDLPDRQVESLAQQAHRAFQGGLGSGYDVACSCRGGLVVATPIPHVGFSHRTQCERFSLPSDLDISLVTGGEDVMTSEVVTRVSVAARESAPVRSCLSALSALAESAHVALRVGNADDLVSIAAQYCERERELGELVGIDIVPESVRLLARDLEAHSGACKPSGAGGDGLVAVFAPARAREDVHQAAAARGLQPLGVGCSDMGLTRE